MIYEKNSELSTKINTKIEIYDNTTLKQLMEKSSTKEFEKMNQDDLRSLNPFSNYTMIVTDLLDDNNTKKIRNKKIICDSCSEKHEFNFEEKCYFIFELSEITFVALYLNYNNERYNINLKINDFNFYIVGNIINKTFLQYYMKNILHNDICINTDTEELKSSYKLELMDHEVNLLSLTDSQYIIIKKNGYIIGDTNCNSGEEEKLLYNDQYDLLDENYEIEK
jgi:hypothetical protein